MFWRLIYTFVEITGEKVVKGGWEKAGILREESQGEVRDFCKNPHQSESFVTRVTLHSNFAFFSFRYLKIPVFCFEVFYLHF